MDKDKLIVEHIEKAAEYILRETRGSDHKIIYMFCKTSGYIEVSMGNFNLCSDKECGNCSRMNKAIMEELKSHEL